MTDFVRTLNDDGVGQFRNYLQRLRDGARESPPVWLLIDSASSAELVKSIEVEQKSFASRLDFGVYLGEVLKPLGRRSISHDHALWTWLSLYFFDELCPLQADGARKVLEDAVYVLPARYNHQRYYRHIARTSWLTVSDHGENAKVLLSGAERGSRSEIFEQIASRQGMLGNPTIVAGAFALYFDKAKEKSKKGAGGKGAGSPRRLAAIVQQLELTYDLAACNVSQLLDLLPREFDRFKLGNESG
jgi:hypothetical protein